MYRPSAMYAGLFGATGPGGSLQNVALVGGSITGDGAPSGDCGALVGYSGSPVTNCYSTATVSGLHSVGGLIGLNASSVASSYATGSVTGGSVGTGGLVGTNNGSINNCYATGSISASQNDGGLVGISASGSTMSNHTPRDPFSTLATMWEGLLAIIKEP